MNEVDCVELGFAYAEVCGAFTGERMESSSTSSANPFSQRSSDSQSEFNRGRVYWSIFSPRSRSRTAAETQRNIVKRGKRSVISQALHTKSDKKATAAWRQDLDGVLRVFNVSSVASA